MVSQGKQKGFTIVELLIVIVVIGILAAISIVAYTGITKQANINSAKSNASNVADAANAINAQSGSFPTLTGTSFTDTTGSVTISSPKGVKLTTTPLGTTNTDVNTIYYKAKGTTGACIIGKYQDNTESRFLVGDATASDC